MNEVTFTDLGNSYRAEHGPVPVGLAFFLRPNNANGYVWLIYMHLAYGLVKQHKFDPVSDVDSGGVLCTGWPFVLCVVAQGRASMDF